MSPGKRRRVTFADEASVVTFERPTDQSEAGEDGKYFGALGCVDKSGAGARLTSRRNVHVNFDSLLGTQILLSRRSGGLAPRPHLVRMFDLCSEFAESVLLLGFRYSA